MKYSRIAGILLTSLLMVSPAEAVSHFKGIASSNQVVFLGPDSETNNEVLAQFVVPEDAEITAVGVNVASNTLNGPVVVRLRIDGSDSSFASYYSAGATGITVEHGIVPVTGTDLVSIALDATGATVGQARVTVSIQQQPIALAPASVPAVSPLGLLVLILVLALSGIAWMRTRAASGSSPLAV